MNNQYFRGQACASKLSVEVLQLNSHKCEAATIDHSKRMCSTEKGKNIVKIGLVQEPSITTKNKLNGYSKDLKTFHYTGKFREKETLRAAVITTSNLNCWPLLQFFTPDQAVIAFKSQNKTFVYASTYMAFDSKDNPPPKFLRELITFCNN